MSSFVSPERVIVSEKSTQQLCTTEEIPDRFEDVYSYSEKDKGAKINLPKYISYETEDIEQHKIMIHLVHSIVSIRDHNHRAKHEDDIIDETSAYSDTIMHFGTDAVLDYINNNDHCEVLQHLADVLRIYTLYGYHDPHPNIYDASILRREPGAMFAPEITI